MSMRCLSGSRLTVPRGHDGEDGREVSLGRARSLKGSGIDGLVDAVIGIPEGVAGEGPGGRRVGRVRVAWWLIRYCGARWAWFRLRYRWRLRAGQLALRMPLSTWAEVPDLPESEAALGFIPRGDDQRWRAQLGTCDARNGGARAAILEEAESIRRGKFSLFGCHRMRLGFPPPWNRNPMTGEMSPISVHWSRLPDFAGGDIKCVWELSRFAWAFVLGRAYARTGDEAFAEAFWALFEDWLGENPPNHGPQWKCGQEASIRLFAAAWARRSLSGAGSTTEARLAQWRRFVYATGRRIAADLDYALSQRNNHGLSECVGLLTVAALLPSAPEAGRWRERARRALCRHVGDVVYADGAFSQHSSVYHRVAVDVLSWCIAMQRSTDSPLDDVVVDATRRAAHFLRRLVDPTTGSVPLCGGNDGAQVLPLAEGGHLDFRGSVQAASVLCDDVAVLGAGPWDEAVGWLNGGRLGGRAVDAGEGAVFSATVGGWHLMQQDEGRAFLRGVKRFRHRPAQADLLHVDIWWRRQPVTHDAGSYSYNCTGPFSGALRDTRVHNTVEVDGTSQMVSVNRFLYLPWPRGTISIDAENLTVGATHDGYRWCGVDHRRVVRAEGAAGWIVEDELISRSARHVYRLHWLLADWPYRCDLDEGQLLLDMPGGRYCVRWRGEPRPSRVTMVRADPCSDRGWWSPYYLRAEPALSLEVLVDSDSGARFQTVFGPTA